MINSQLTIIKSPLLVLSLIVNLSPVWANDPPTDPSLDLDPEIIKESPVLQRWLEKPPNVLKDIRHDPSFRTRFRIGYSQFTSEDVGGLNLGVEDIFIGRTGLTLSGNYQTSFDEVWESGGADLQYYILPLGYYVNVAPVVGYRYVENHDYSTDGVNLGLKIMLPLSRNGAADLSITQSFVSPGGYNEVGRTVFTAGYAVTSDFRVSADFEQQNTREDKESRFGIVLEWMP
ncbi:conserved hypothetical protein [Gloeothece citriformis PCC 7424]|uniref:Outer membrane protein beta-barrel domain-containing protein n=1 Tax=Gloeothece citriformis (strain PCC 7424) TaxID=65393 RepID=B7KJ69_GLOC7|nr:hypothetical protein [Gloeothece citriformis]ACK72153.1 conserved hypothetical protein [Gloeothece citriformis PCC 7424]